MYITRPRSLYRHFPGSLSVRPPQDASYSGQLVLTDEESETLDYSLCCGICTNDRISRTPFPQNRILKVVHASIQEEASVTKVWFVPVLHQPLSSNRYYIIKAKGKHKGQAYRCSRTDDVGVGCFSKVPVDPKLRPLDYRDRYQQFEIHRYYGGGFIAKSVEWDGYPPKFLRNGGWEVYTTHSFRLHITEAQGLNNPSTFNLPEFEDVPLYSRRSTPVVIAKWYCPFVLIKDQAYILKEQMEKSLFYELSLKQWWEQIYTCEKQSDQNNVVFVDARVKRLVTLVSGMEAERDSRQDIDGFVQFRVKEQCRRRISIGLSSAIMEKMRWLQETRGWFDGAMEVRVAGSREIEGGNGWSKFGCYVLVESFVLRRMDGSLVINFTFRNPQRIECKWE